MNAGFDIGLQLLAAFRHVAVLGHDDLIGGDRGDSAGFGRDDDGARVARHFAFEAGADERRFGNDQRHALALHVRAHQRAVRVIVLEERNQAGRDGNELLRRNIHVVDLARFHFQKVAAVTDGNFFSGEMTFRVHRRIRLRDDEIFFAIAGQIIDLIGHAAVLDFSIGRFDETEFVDPREGASSS